MGMPGSNYQAPKGFYQNYSFDKNGQVFADGKELNGVRLDPSSITPDGKLVGLSTDSKGNVFAEMQTRKPSQSPMLSWVTGETRNPTPVAMAGGKPAASTNPFEHLNPYQISRVPLSGVQLDPSRFSKSGDGDLGTNQLYLRPDQSGAYFAQVNSAGNVVAYAYSALQQAKNPVGGAEAPTSNNQRRQGGNAGGGTSPTSSMVSLLGD